MKNFKLSLKGPRPLAGIRIVGALVVFCALILGLCEEGRAEMRKIDTLIIHHTAGRKATARDLTVAEVDTYHKAKGWDSIGYHYLIRANGKVNAGRPIQKIGAHALGRNAHSIGIALTGYDQFTLDQKTSLTKLIKELCERFPIKSIERHHKYCPGDGLNVEEIEEEFLLHKKNELSE